MDRRNFHLFQPLLYQVATGALSPANIAAPLRAVLRRQKNTRVLLADVSGFDVARRVVHLRDGTLEYDTLVVAAGARHHYFGHPEWEDHAPGLKTLEDATEIRRRMLSAFEIAERASDPDTVRACLTFVVVGAGPTGVELAGAVAEIAKRVVRDDFRSFDPKDARVLLVEGGDRVLPPFPPALSERAEQSLNALGVTVRKGSFVTDISDGVVTLKHGDATEEIRTRTIVWAAGVRASPLARDLSEQTGAELDRAGRIIVQEDLTLAGHDEIFVVGDMAAFHHQEGGPLPGVAPVAMQQGRYVAEVLKGRHASGETRPPFRYRDKGSMATIGRAAAVADLGFVRFGGFVAWVVWLFVHLMYIVGYANRALVLLQWAWSYVTFNRSARLITERAPKLEPKKTVRSRTEDQASP